MNEIIPISTQLLDIADKLGMYIVLLGIVFSVPISVLIAGWWITKAIDKHK